MKHQQWGQFALASPPKSDPDEVAYGVLRQPRRGWMCEKFYRLQSREKNALLTSPSIGLSHSNDGGHMNKPKTKTGHFTCYEKRTFSLAKNTLKNWNA